MTMKPSDVSVTEWRGFLALLRHRKEVGEANRICILLDWNARLKRLGVRARFSEAPN